MLHSEKLKNPVSVCTVWSNCNNTGISFGRADLTLLPYSSPHLRRDLFPTRLEIVLYELCLSSVRATCFADLISLNFIMYVNYWGESNGKLPPRTCLGCSVPEAIPVT